MKEYQQGMTKVHVDFDKIVITNTSGKQHVKANVDEIFGVGEFNKIHQVRFSEELKKPKRSMNPHARTYELVSNYIPERAMVDMGLVKPKKEKVPEDQLPGLKAEDLIEEYFE